MTEWLEPAEAMVRIYKALEATLSAPQDAEVTIHMHPEQFERLVRHYSLTAPSDPVPFPVNEPPLDYDWHGGIGDPEWKIFRYRVVPEPDWFPRSQIRIRMEVKA